MTQWLVELEPLNSAHIPPSIPLSKGRPLLDTHLEEFYPYLLPLPVPQHPLLQLPPGKPGPGSLSLAAGRAQPRTLDSCLKLWAQASRSKAQLYQAAQAPHSPPSTPGNSSVLHARAMPQLTDSPSHHLAGLRWRGTLCGGEQKGVLCLLWVTRSSTSAHAEPQLAQV